MISPVNSRPARFRAIGFDFAAGGDRIHVRAFGLADVPAMFNDTEVIGDDAVIPPGDDDTEIPVDTDPASLRDDNLLLA